MKHQTFDRLFLQSFIKNEHLLQYATHLFSVARNELKQLPGYGMIRVIAIKKATITDQKTNYVWRSHAFGVLCKCQHTKRKYGHDEFIATLEDHQKDNYKPCNTKNKPLPQYRILASNLDRDPTKMIFTMDCLDKNEKERFRQIYSKLKVQLLALVRLESLDQCAHVRELADVLKLIDFSNFSSTYRAGYQTILRQNVQIINSHSEALEQALSRSHYSHMMEAINISY